MEATSLAGKIALITGAGCGIGKATAVLFAKLGARLLLVDLREADLNATANECNGISKTPVLPIVADVTDDHMVQVIHQKTLDKFGGLDILVNNAGVYAKDSPENFDPEAFDRLIKLHLRAPIMLTHAFIPALVKSKGAVVNLSSMYSLRPNPDVMSYGVSKAGQDIFTQCAALQLAPKGVRVNSTHPGVTITSGLLNIGYSEKENNEFWEAQKDKEPIGRCAQPIEIARTIAFLASPAASFITAAHVSVDGGITATCNF